MPFSTLASLAGLFGNSSGSPSTLTDREILAYARVKRCYPDCDSNFIAYLILANRRQPTPTSAQATPSTSHTTKQRCHMGTTVASKPGHLSTTATAQPRKVSTGRALTERVVDKIEALGQLYPREPTLNPSSAETTTAYANYCLDVLNAVFPSWSVEALRDWLTVTLLSQPALTTVDRTLPVTSSRPATPHGLAAVFPDRMVDEYFDHCDHCVKRSEVATVTPWLWPNAWLRGNVASAIRGHEATPVRPRLAKYFSNACTTHLCPPIEPGPRSRPGFIPTRQYFRSPQYHEGALARLLNAFPRLYRSTIEAVLAEHCMDYCTAYSALRHLSETQPRSWVVGSILNFLPSRTQHADQPSMFHVDLLRDVDQLHAQKTAEAVGRDEAYARAVNEAEYRTAGQLITCECCYSDVAFEDLVPCTANQQPRAHLCCKDCLGRFVQEVVHGQGGGRQQQRMAPADFSVGCIGDSDCGGWYTDYALQRALPVNLYSQWHRWLQAQSLNVWRATVDPWTLAQCPACDYVELVPRAPTYTWWGLAARTTWVLALGFLVGVICLWLLYRGTCLLPVGIVLPLLYCLCFGGTSIMAQIVIHHYKTGRVSHRLCTMWQQANARTSPRLLRCRNPDCGWRPCPMCMKSWTPDHQCGESARESLRRYVERAMDEAVKRTCPRCHLSFTKSDGCNKMTCRCGYVMCYICRRDIAQESYQHFCQHFRMIPGTQCQECSRCDLYHCDDDEVTRQHAAEQAQEAFLASSARNNINTDDVLSEPLALVTNYYFANGNDYGID